jgi:eukaryotic-like serine/threonine-protein kinase
MGAVVGYSREKAMSSPEANRDLLLGHLAVELNFISAETLAAAKQAWTSQNHTSMGQVLVDHQAISPHTRDALENLVQLQMAQDASDADGSPPGEANATDLGVVDDLIAPPSSVDGVQAEAPELRFRKLKAHAEGALGQVFIARDKELHRKVALKEIKERYADQPDARSRFLLEAEITGQLEHPGVVPVYGLGRYANGRPFYAMRFIKGESLADAIKELHSPVNLERDPQERVLELRSLLGRLIDVCNTMQYAHDRDIVHRDLKPSNIMLGAYGETLVGDWGLAKVLGKLIADPTGSVVDPLPGGSSSDTLPGRALGTITYMSPEQAAGRLDLVGPRSDVYSLGATLFTLLTGRVCVEDSNPLEPTKIDLRKLQRKVMEGDIQRPRAVKPDIDPALEAICVKAMALKLDDRYSCARALADDLERWLADEPVSAWSEPWTVSTRRWLDRHHTLVTGAAAALLVGLVSLLAATIFLSDEIARTHEANQGRDEALSKAQLAKTQAEKERGAAVKARDDLAAAFHWTWVVHADPTVQQSWTRLDEACRQLKSYAPALDLCMRLAKEQPDFELKWQDDGVPWMNFLLARAHHRLGNHDAARRCFDLARLPPNAGPDQRQSFQDLRTEAAAELGLKLEQ